MVIAFFSLLSLNANPLNKIITARRFPELHQAAVTTSKALTEYLLKTMEKGNTVGYINEKGLSQVGHAEQAAQNMMEALKYKKTDLECPYKVEAILAALFHDIGHLCAEKEAKQMDGDGVCDHEKIGAQFLLKHGLSQRVANLVASHAQAKRYLITTKPGYFESLSPASQRTFNFQGGRMTPEECKAFEDAPDFDLKITLREADDTAKDPNAVVTPLEDYREPLQKYFLNKFFYDLELLQQTSDQ